MATDEQLKKAMNSIGPLLDEAYSAGFSAGYKVGEAETARRLKARMAGLLDLIDSVGEEPSRSPQSDDAEDAGDSEQAESAERAAPGTVKPTILNLLKESRVGLTTRQISDVTGFKHNSVRGTIWALQKDGEITRGEDYRWIVISATSSEPEPKDELNLPEPKPEAGNFAELLGGGQEAKEPPDPYHDFE